jgi:DNA-binding NtrC family response regulator
MRCGTVRYDYISKPFNLDELSIVVRKALETSDLKQEVVRLRTKQSMGRRILLVKAGKSNT